MSQQEADPAPPAFVRKLEHLMDFVDTASVGLHWVGPDGTILWANPADYEPLGYEAHEYIGHNITEFHADPEVIQDILDRLRRGERIHNYAARLKCKDGSVRHVEITSSVLFEGNEGERKFVHTRCYTQDVTERRKMEEARDRLVAVLGHDLRNPLSSILMATERLVRSPGLGHDHQQTVKQVARAAKRMSRLVTDLVDFARTLGQGITIARRPADFAQICATIVEEAQVAKPDAEIVLHTSGDARGHWDPDRVAQAVSNLVGNAFQHGQPPVHVRVQAEEDAVVLEVSNRGEPIPAADLPHVFEPFTAGSTAGTGLGLFIVHEIVAAHRGKIRVTSTPEKTAFVSTWPKQDDLLST